MTSGSDYESLIDLRSPGIWTLLLVAFLYPILSAAIFFPTPSSDLRENIDWGLLFPLYTWKHPPLSSWIAGLLALSGARDAWPYILVAQILNFIGLWYVARTAQVFIGASSIAVSVIAIAGSLYFIVDMLTHALTTDQLQFCLWSGTLYHALQALRKDRWRDWLAAAVFAGLSLLSKYFALAFIAALVAATIWTQAGRPLRNARFYAAAFVCALIFSVNAIPTLQHAESLRYGLHFFDPESAFVPRVSGILLFLSAILLYGFPFIIGLSFAAWRQQISIVDRLRAERRIIVTTAVALSFIILVLIGVAGLHYERRYTNPQLGLIVLGLLCIIRVTPEGLRYCVRATLCGWCTLVIATIAYAFTFVHDRLREPAPAAAALLADAWDSQFSCGPAYILGPPRSAHGVAIYFNRPLTGISIYDYLFAPWFDRDRLRSLGAIVVATTDAVNQIAFRGEFPARTSPQTFSLPYRHTISLREHHYVYYFVPPMNCPSGAN